MDFVNHTPFPALAYAGIDQHEQIFHIVALRQSLAFASGTLAYADVQTPLCDSDLPLDPDRPRDGLRQESDLCPYKPRCDVIANTTAYAPAGGPCALFTAGLAVTRPPRPDAPPATLIDKTLTIRGPRAFTRRGPAGLFLRQVLRAATFGILTPPAWTLGAPQAITMLPLRPCHAYGGEYRIDTGDATRPMPHVACAANPAGTGLADAAAFKAGAMRSVAAPQIEHPGAALDADLFCLALKRGTAGAAVTRPAAFEPAGFGPRAKAHPDRGPLVGTIDQAFVDGGAALPADFDFAFWNAAPPDQQTDFLQGDETFELVNLCAPDAPGARSDAQGNTSLRLTLPGHECFLLCRQRDGVLYRHPMALDTVLIEPEHRSVTLVWRAVLPVAPALRACEARMWTHAERDRAAPETVAFAAMAVAADVADAVIATGALK